MLAFIVRRLVISFFVLVAGTYLMYILVANSGNPLADLQQNTSPNRDQLIEARINLLDLDVPSPLRYFIWAKGAAGCLVPFAMECDLGTSVTGQDVTALMSTAMGQTFQLILAATVLAIIIGVSAGIVTALRQYSGLDYTVTFASFLFFSLPVFWVAVLLKEFGAIEFNNWLADPSISIPICLVIGLLSGLAWMSIIGGDRNRRLMTFASAFVAAGGLAWVLSETRWFADPSLGPILVILLSVGVAFLVTALVAGYRYRSPLYAALISAGVGAVCYFALAPVLEDPNVWLIIGLGVIAVAVGLAAGYFVGGLQRRPAMQTGAITAFGSAAIIFIDYSLAAWDGYSDRVGGRVIATIGSRTPNFDGDFWETTLDTATHLVLPTAALILISIATYSRYARSSMLEVMNQDYVRTGRAKGLTERTVVVKHAFRNALIPLTTLVAFDFAAVIGGAVITETVFGWAGMGTMFRDALDRVDPNPVMAFYVVTGGATVVLNMLADIGYAYLDPRIRLS